VARGIAPEAAQRLLDLTTVAQDKANAQTLKALREMLPVPQAQQALDDLETLCQITVDAPAGPRLRIAPALARGLSYYTGPIFEVVSEDFSGSLGGGDATIISLGCLAGSKCGRWVFARAGTDFTADGRAADVPCSAYGAQVMVCPLPDTPLAPVVGLTSRLRQRELRRNFLLSSPGWGGNSPMRMICISRTPSSLDPMRWRNGSIP